MERKLLIARLVLCLTAIAGAQTESGEIRATTADGRQVILYPDGRWEFEDDRLYNVSEADIGSYAEVDLSLTIQAIVIIFQAIGAAYLAFAFISTFTGGGSP